MAEWEWHAYDAVSEAELGLVPMDDWSHESRHNDWGAWSGTLADPVDKDRARLILAATRESQGRTVIIPYRSTGPGIGTPPDGFAGWLPPGGYRSPGEIAGPGIGGYLNDRVLDFSYSVSGIDLFDLAKQLVD